MIFSFFFKKKSFARVRNIRQQRPINVNVIFLQDWFAFSGNGSEFNFTLTGEAIFSNCGNPTAEDNYGFCQVRVTDRCQ